MFQIVINANLYLTEPVESDIPFFIKLINNKNHYNNTLRIPFPYTENDAIQFLGFAQQLKQKFKRPMCWQLRNTLGEMIGGIGLLGIHDSQPHKDEIGYWVAEAYSGKGIATEMLQVFCNYVFKHYGLSRIEAHVFSFNKASMRVLEKADFIQEGFKSKCYLKDNKFIDAYAYALVK